MRIHKAQSQLLYSYINTSSRVYQSTPRRPVCVHTPPAVKIWTFTWLVAQVMNKSYVRSGWHLVCAIETNMTGSRAHSVSGASGQLPKVTNISAFRWWQRLLTYLPYLKMTGSCARSFWHLIYATGTNMTGTSAEYVSRASRQLPKWPLYLL